MIQINQKFKCTFKVTKICPQCSLRLEDNKSRPHGKKAEELKLLVSVLDNNKLKFKVSRS